MLVKLLIAMAIMMVILFSGVTLDSQAMQNSVSDKKIEATAAIIDTALVNYYTSHSGDLPSTLNTATLEIMGLQDVDMTPYTYTRKSAQQFTLQAKLSKETKSTVHSGTNLPTLPDE